MDAQMMIPTRPVVSVCIANFNGMEVIDDCIRSIRAQQKDIAVEILIHDDASTDASVSHVRKNYPEARLVVSEANVGFCVANNRMAAQAKGEYLLLLNNDAALCPDALGALLGEAKNIGKPAILTLPQYDATTGVLVDRGCLLDPFFNPVPNLDPNRLNVAMVIGACLWIPKQLWDELEGFPEWFGSIAEDMYLCCRARLAGFAVRALQESGYRHWQGKSFGGNRVEGRRLVTTFRRRALSERNKTFVMWVCLSPPALAMLMPLHFASLLLEGALLTIVKRSTTPYLEIYAPLLPALWKNRVKLTSLRREIQTKTVLPGHSFFDPFRLTPWKLQMLFKHGLPNIRSTK
jgi:GT2 family glycosyltransferase